MNRATRDMIRVSGLPSNEVVRILDRLRTEGWVLRPLTWAEAVRLDERPVVEDRTP